MGAAIVKQEQTQCKQKSGIENLGRFVSVFAEEDIISLNLKDTKGRYIKHSSTSALIKTFSNDYQFNQITLNNFKKIFDFLKNVLD